MAKILDALFACSLSFLVFMLALSFTECSLRLCALISLASSACVYVLVFHFSEKRQHRAPSKRIVADKRVRGLIYASARQAHSDVFSVLAKRYPLHSACFSGGELRFVQSDFDEGILFVLQKLRVSPDDILSAWRTHGAGHSVHSLVIAVPGRSENDIRVLAYRLKDPNVIILDKKQLRGLFRKYASTKAPSANVRSVHPLKALKDLITRRRARRYALYSLLLTAYYVLTGHLFYLLSGLFLLAAATLGLFQKDIPETLI